MSAQRLAALVLAAGKGSRLGGGKMNLPWQGKPLLTHVLSLAEKSACFDHFGCVVGYEAHKVCAKAECFGIQGTWKFANRLPPVQPSVIKRFPFWHALYNPSWEAGQSTSLLTGINWLLNYNPARHVAGVIVFLGDQPLVCESTVRKLALSHHEMRKQYDNNAHPLAIAPVYQGKRGNPVLLDKDIFPSLKSLTGDTGARNILHKIGSRLHLLNVDDPGVIFDVDTPQNYQFLQTLP